MRRIIYAVLAVTLLTLSSCGDLLDKTPVNSQTFDNIAAEKDLEGLLNSCEYYLRNAQTDDAIYPALIGEYADAVTYSDFAIYRDLSFGQEASHVNWQKYYYIVSTAEIVLRSLDMVDMTDERRDYYEGTANFYIAYSYLKMIKVFGEVPLVKGEVPVGPLAKSSWPVVADYAIECATKAAEMLTGIEGLKNYNDTPIGRRSLPTRDAAYALLTDLATWKAGGVYHMNPEDRDFDVDAMWELAEASATKIIENSATYQLESTPEELMINYREGSIETIYEVKFYNSWNDIDRPTFIVHFGRACQGFPNNGDSEQFTSRMTYNIYQTTVDSIYHSGDLRRTSFFVDKTSDVYTQSQRDNMAAQKLAYPHKFRYGRFETEGYNVGEFINYDQNYVEYRLADIILLRAEARERLGKTAEAIADLNLIRKRANAPLYDTSEHNGDLRYTIFAEREKELIYECKRYFDIIRNGYHRILLSEKHVTLTDQDYIDGAFFMDVPYNAFINNELMRYNKYWVRNR